MFLQEINERLGVIEVIRMHKPVSKSMLMADMSVKGIYCEVGVTLGSESDGHCRQGNTVGIFKRYATKRCLTNNI